jgi:hypothetical protein
MSKMKTNFRWRMTTHQRILHVNPRNLLFMNCIIKVKSKPRQSPSQFLVNNLMSKMKTNLRWRMTTHQRILHVNPRNLLVMNCISKVKSKPRQSPSQFKVINLMSKMKTNLRWRMTTHKRILHINPRNLQVMNCISKVKSYPNQIVALDNKLQVSPSQFKVINLMSNW